MWFFSSPKIIFGEDAINWLADLKGSKAFVVTDETMVKLGFLDLILEQLKAAGLESANFSKVEPEPSLGTVERCAAEMGHFCPDWIIGLGGGSCLDAAKAAWVLYECPEVSLKEINPLETYGLRQKARLITIPTTAGSGADVSQAAILMDIEEKRKIEIVSYEFMADYSIVDPRFSLDASPILTAETGIDVLCHTIDTFNSTFANDFIDGLCLQAIRLVFDYLPAAVLHGRDDPHAREKMANAATIAGLAVANSNIALVHALGHGAGAVLHMRHGRVTAIFLPGVIEYNTCGGVGRYLELADRLGLKAGDEQSAGIQLARVVRELMHTINLPTSLKKAGVNADVFEREIDNICDRVEMDLGLVSSRRFPYRDDIRRLLEYAYEGRPVDF
jgi:alcohol dehydrogenase class IV